ncbi:MAG: glycosyltransferase family 1 protein [Chloroflexota bacterium]|nr:glycosyltransferase family 1 protein [Chloroflexota bacterium]
MGMRIGLNAHLLSGRAGYRSAGIHGYISNLLRHLPMQAPADWGFQALVGAANSASFPGVSMARARMDTEQPWRRIVWEQALQPWQLRRFDLYHAMAFVAPLILTAPMVVTVYDLSFLRFPARLSAARRAYLRAMTALTCARARRVLAISQSTANDLTERLALPADKIDVTPLGYDKTAFRPLLEADIAHFRRKQNLPDRFWLFVGTLEPRKNLPALLQAYARLPRDARLPLILGGGIGWMAQDTFAAIERLNLGDSVKHAGFIPIADLPLWYNCAEAFLYPSVYEGFGLPVLEAMACGAPVITTEASSLPEVAGAAAMCLPPQDIERWTAALADLRRNGEWREMARLKGLERAKQFSWARTAELTLASYRKAAAWRDLPLGESEKATRVESK